MYHAHNTSGNRSGDYAVIIKSRLCHSPLPPTSRNDRQIASVHLQTADRTVSVAAISSLQRGYMQRHLPTEPFKLLILPHFSSVFTEELLAIIETLESHKNKRKILHTFRFFSAIEAINQ